jgi:hypothetical protein
MKAIAPEWLDVDFPFECEVHAPRFWNNLSPTQSFRVYVDTWEPRTSCESIDTIRKFSDRFNLIMTCDESLLDLPNARLFVGGSSWVYPWQPESKEFSVSFLCTNNSFLPGYLIRHQLWHYQNHVSIPKKFWSSRWRPVDNNRLIPERSDGLNEKVALFYSMFSVCPENTTQKNYFTEKILDCFVTKTVPVYWGCPNIGDYFDTRGIIQINGIEDLITKLNNLTPETYQEMLPYIESNYNIASKYSQTEKKGNDRFRDAVVRYYEELK